MNSNEMMTELKRQAHEEAFNKYTELMTEFGIDAAVRYAMGDVVRFAARGASRSTDTLDNAVESVRAAAAVKYLESVAYRDHELTIQLSRVL